MYMKRFILSDIHGSAPRLERALHWFDAWGGDQLILLGDLLYHGPRNDLPEGYDPKKCIGLYEKYKEHIIAVRGNCDSEVDQMVLDFPMTADYALLVEGKQKMFLTHGHIYGEEAMPSLSANDIFFSGHTHIPVMKQVHSIHVINPGSISIPKGNSLASFGVLEDGVFQLVSLDGEILATYHCQINV